MCRRRRMNPAIAGLARMLKLPIALFRIEGGYGVHPRWSDVVRRGRMHAYVSRVIEPEEFAGLSKAELESGWAEYYDGLEQLQDAKEELDDAKAELEDADEQLADGWEELEDARRQLEEAETELVDGRAELDDGWRE